MGSWVLTEATVATCPHGGTATFQAGQSAVTVNGSAVLILTSTTTVSGCPFTIGNTPSPCLTVRWMGAATRVTAGGAAVIHDASTGLCLSGASSPQGSLQIKAVQARVSAT